MINAQRLKEVADILKKEIPDLGFSLIVFETGGNPGDLSEYRYISNCKRESMIESLEAMLQKWKNQNVQDN